MRSARGEKRVGQGGPGGRCKRVSDDGGGGSSGARSGGRREEGDGP